MAERLEKYMKLLLAIAMLAALTGCQSAYYGMAEKVGYHKREILVDRVNESRDAQEEAKEEFQSALEQLSALVDFDGGELEKVYSDMNARYEDARAAAGRVTERIDAVEDVARALFREWEAELEEYTSKRLRAESEDKLRQTRSRYERMVDALRRAESSMEPVLAALQDNVLYLKHNLNARAVASLKTEFRAIEEDIQSLISDVRDAIEAADAFIKTME